MCRDLRKSDLPVASMQQQTPLQTGMRTGRSAAQAEEDPRFPVDLCLLSGSFQSKVSLLSSLGWITSWQLLWWPCNPLVCTCTSNQRGCPCVRAWHLERVPVSPTGGNRMVGKKLQPSAAPLGSAQLRSVKPKIIHNLSYETEEEGETEGEEVMTERCGAPRTRQHGQTVISLSSQLQDTPHTVQPLKLFSSFLPALGSFAPSLFPRRSQAVRLVNPGRLIALCISPQENGTDLQTDRKKRQKSLIDGENEDEEMRSWRERGRERKREKERLERRSQVKLSEDDGTRGEEGGEKQQKVGQSMQIRHELRANQGGRQPLQRSGLPSVSQTSSLYFLYCLCK